jgi:hypothetical protein
MGPLLAAAAAAAARTRACRGAVSPASSSVTLLTCTVRVPPSIRAASTAARRARAKPRILSAVSCASRRRPATSARRSWRAVVPAMRIAWRAARCMGSILATAARRARAASRTRATAAAASGREARRRIAWTCSRSRRAHWIAALAAAAAQHNAHTLRTPKHEGLYTLLLLLNTTRTRSGPPSTRATITMDGGVADTARANTNNSCEHKPLVGGSWGKREYRTSICASLVPPFPRMYSKGTNRATVRSGHICRRTHARAPRRRKPRKPDPHSQLVPHPRGGGREVSEPAPLCACRAQPCAYAARSPAPRG